MNRPIPPLFFVGVFLIILIAAVLMLANLIGHQEPPVANSTPEDALALQLALVAEGNTAALRLTFTEELRASITAEVVEAARSAHEGVTLEALVGKIEREQTPEGVEKALVLRPDGSLLTQLLLVDGEWQADTVWFR
jgi:hypothetical protein